MKDTNKLFKNILRALPAIPFIARKKTSVAPLVFAAVGVAIAGGIAAVMIFSPRTRYRALDIAKEGYGKVRNQMDQRGVMAHGEKNTTATGYANGLGSESSNANYSSGGL